MGDFQDWGGSVYHRGRESTPPSSNNGATPKVGRSNPKGMVIQQVFHRFYPPTTNPDTHQMSLPEGHSVQKPGDLSKRVERLSQRLSDMLKKRDSLSTPATKDKDPLKYETLPPDATINYSKLPADSHSLESGTILHMNGEEAEKELLSNKEMRCFLLRTSSQKGYIALSFKNGEKITHTRLHQKGNIFKFEDIRDNHTFFKSLEGGTLKELTDFLNKEGGFFHIEKTYL